MYIGEIGITVLHTFIQTVRSLRRRVVKVSLRYILRAAAIGASSPIVSKLSDEAPQKIA